MSHVKAGLLPAGLARAQVVEEETKMRIAVIGGTGHIGSYLTPMLVETGHEVVCVCRGIRPPYHQHSAWNSIAYLRIDRAEEEKAGTFGGHIANINADAVIDLTCYYPSSAEQLVTALSGRIGHLLHCGTIWVHGPSGPVPTNEDQARHPFGDYGIRKAAIEAWLLEKAVTKQLPVTVLHPGHLVGPGWVPINPTGNFNVEIFAALSQGNEVRMPNFGMETLQHVHAEDVARAFVLAVKKRDAAIGQSFHVVAASAMTMRWYAEQMAEWFNQPSRLIYLPWEEWRKSASSRDAAITEDHLRHSPHCSIEKARRLLDYEPRYSPLAAVQESVTWLLKNSSLAGTPRA
jgi:nucleoside-diphosphate-sugar epimerase